MALPITDFLLLRLKKNAIIKEEVFEEELVIRMANHPLHFIHGLSLLSLLPYHTNTMKRSHASLFTIFQHMLPFP